ncbi:glycosyltransferase family 4 protein [Pontibaca salina]|uniref:Glycosyltransferase family 4 protein n=1 Tax=Pontibaca salina TaxID=2795731 RepID=A0A934LYX5_9RHOB|nr:glycosyltransferase family 4 protein [Pontibaca salina]MBI6630267.1 glycosyltransferase family 4 protein [Pontibaca salina]
MTTKVCHILDNLRPGVGVTQIIFDLMSDERIDCRGLYIGASDIDPRFDDKVFKISPVDGFFDTLKQLRNLRSQGFNVLHVHSRKADMIAMAARLLGYRVIRTQHFGTITDSSPVSLRRKGFARLRNALTLRTWWVSRWAAVSSTSVAYLAQRWHIPARRISVIYNGIDLDLYHELSCVDKTRRRQALGWEKDWIVFISVGSLVTRKRHSEIIRQFADIAANYPAARLVIAGAGSERGKLEALKTQLGLEERVQLLGHRADVPDLLQASDVYVHGAIDEAFGLVVIEGMACGLPAIAYDAKGPAEIVTDGETGILVPPTQDGALTTAMATLASQRDLCEIMGRQARERVERQFSLSAMREAYLQEYIRLGINSD